MWKTCVDLVKSDGFLGFYRGMTSPLTGVVAVNAFLFGVYGYLLDLQQENSFNSDSTIEGEYSPPLSHVFWAGAGSGLVNSLISCPTELAKIQMQNKSLLTQVSAGNASVTSAERKGVTLFSSPWDCLKQIYKSKGLIGCYRGMVSTIIRETPSYAVYFVSFEAIQRALLHRKHEHYRSSLLETDIYNLPNLNGLELMFAGGMSGVLGWLSTYPVDVIKTRIQTDLRCSSSLFKCAKLMIRQEGLTVMGRGMLATIIRAFPTNAVIFLSYSWTMKALMSRNYQDDNESLN